MLWDFAIYKILDDKFDGILQFGKKYAEFKYFFCAELKVNFRHGESECERKIKSFPITCIITFIILKLLWNIGNKTMLFMMTMFFIMIIFTPKLFPYVQHGYAHRPVRDSSVFVVR